MSGRRTDVALTAVAPLVWGSTYLATTELLPPDRPLLAGLVRSLPAGLILLLIVRTLPHGIWWGRATVLGILNIGAFFALLFVAAYRLPGGVAATLMATQPLFVGGLAALVLREPLRPRTVVTAVVGAVGVALLALQGDAALDPIGIAAGFGGAIVMSLGMVLAKRWPSPVPPLTLTAWQLTAGGLFLLPIALLVEGGLPDEITLTNVAGLAYLTLAASITAYALWFRGLHRLPVSTVAILSLLSPLVATLLGWLVVGERLTALQGLGALLVLGALVVAQRRSPEPGPEAPVPAPQAPEDPARPTVRVPAGRD